MSQEIIIKIIETFNLCFFNFCATFTGYQIGVYLYMKYRKS